MGHDVGHPGVVHAVRAQLLPLPRLGQVDGVEARARLVLQAVGGEEPVEREGPAQAQLARLEDVHRLAHPRPRLGRWQPPAPRQEGDVEADAVEGAQPGGGVQVHDNLFPEVQVLLFDLPFEQEGLGYPLAVQAHAGDPHPLAVFIPLRVQPRGLDVECQRGRRARRALVHWVG